MSCKRTYQTELCCAMCKHGTWPAETYSKSLIGKEPYKSIPDIVVYSVPVDVLAPLSAMTSAGTETMKAKARLNIKTVFPIWDFHYEDRTVVRSSYLYNRNHILVRRILYTETRRSTHPPLGCVPTPR